MIGVHPVGEQHDAVAGMVLRDPHVFEAVFRPAFEPQAAPDAGGDEARAPVPTELALLLAELGAAPDRVVELDKEVVFAAAEPIRLAVDLHG